MGLMGFHIGWNPQWQLRGLFASSGLKRRFAIRNLLKLLGLGLLLPISLPSWAIESEQSNTSLFDLNLADLLNMRVVTAASGFEQNLEDAPASVTIIYAEEWRAMGAENLLDAINGVPGMHISLVQTGLMFEKPIIRGLSGAFGQQVLLLLDGLPFRSVRDGSAPWSQRLSLNGFKRIEIVRGSGSAIYGADAVGGIINLVSYGEGEMPTQLSFAAGENGRKQFGFAKNITWEENHIQVAWSSQYDDGDRHRLVESDFQTWLDSRFNTDASMAPGPLARNFEVHTLKAAWSKGDWSVSYLDWYAPEMGNGAGAAQSLDPDGAISIRTQFLGVDYDMSKRVTGDMNLRFAWHKSRNRTKTTLFPAGSTLILNKDGNIVFPQGEIEVAGGNIVFPEPGAKNCQNAGENCKLVTFRDGVLGNPGDDNIVFSVQLNHIFDIATNHKMRWAIGMEATDIHPVESKNFGPEVYDGESLIVDGTLTDVTDTDSVYLRDASRENYFIAIQDQWKMSENWMATLGVRYDQFSDFDSVTNPRLGLVWHADDKVSVKAFAGTAFRAPSFIDLHARNNPAAVGNPDLEPETVNMVDIGAAANFVLADNLQFETSIFQYSAKKLIAFVQQDSLQVAENSGSLKVRGVEHQINWRSGDQLSIDFNFTFLDPYRSVDVDISSVPQFMSNLNIHFRREQWHVYFGGKWVMQRQRDEQDLLGRKDIDDYFMVNSRVQYSLGMWQASLLVENLFDRDAREPSNGMIANDYPLPGRRLSIEMSRNF